MKEFQLEIQISNLKDHQMQILPDKDQDLLAGETKLNSVGSQFNNKD